jgi:hypothetical protein
MKKPEQAFVGHWRITEMEVWDADYFDMEVPAHITIRKDLTGEFQFGLVQGELDGRVETVDGAPRFDFSWSGFDENDPMCGRGWLRAEGDQAESRVFIHLGDDSGLKAVRQSGRCG